MEALLCVLWKAPVSLSHAEVGWPWGRARAGGIDTHTRMGLTDSNNKNEHLLMLPLSQTLSKCLS